MTNQDTLLKQINDDIDQVSYLLLKLLNDKLVDEDHFAEYLEEQKENEKIVKSQLKGRVDKIIFDITFLIEILSSLQPVNNKEKILSKDNIQWYVFNMKNFYSVVHWVINYEQITSELKENIKNSHSEIFQKNLELKEKIHEYNKQFPKNKILTIEKAKLIVDKKTKRYKKLFNKYF